MWGLLQREPFDVLHLWVFFSFATLTLFPVSFSSSLFQNEVSKCVQQVAQPAFFLRLAELAESEEDAKQRAALEQLAIQVTECLHSVCSLHVVFLCFWRAR